jgi:site-specific DNA-cytosine methylase
MLQFSYIDEPTIEDQTINQDYLKYYLKNEVPKYKNEAAFIKNSAFYKFLFHSSCGYLEAKKQFKAAKEWVEKKMNYMSHQAMIDYYYEKTGHKTLYQKYKSLEWDKPSHTVVAHLSKDGYMFIHPDPEQERSITIREAACLMTFPLDFQFLGSTPYNYKMIGNAVPVNFAKAIAKGICKSLDKKSKQ